MKIKETYKVTLNWGNNRKFGFYEAVFQNGKFENFRFDGGDSLTETKIWSCSIEYLIELHKVLGELIDYYRAIKSEGKGEKCQ